MERADPAAAVAGGGGRRRWKARAAWRRIAAVALLSAATLGFFASDARFVASAPRIAPDFSFSGGLARWPQTPGAVFFDSRTGTVAIVPIAPGRAGALARDIAAPQRFRYVRVALDARVEGVAPGKESWQRAGVSLRAVLPGPRFDPYWPAAVLALDGTTRWRHYEAVIPVHAEAARLRLLLYNAGLSGRLFLRDLAVEAVAERPLAKAARWALIGLWVALGLWAAAPALALGFRRPAGRAMIATGAAILVLVLTPQPELANAIKGLSGDADRAIAWVAGERTRAPAAVAETARATQAQASPPARAEAAARAPAPKAGEKSGAGPGPVMESVRAIANLRLPGGLGPQDVGHFLAFAAFGFFAFAAFPELGRRTLLVYLLVAAGASEVIQSFLVTRTTQITDAALNAGGLLLGALAFALWRRARRAAEPRG